MRRAVAATAIAALIVSCSPAAGREVVVFAASSLTEAFTELGRRFERAHPGTTVTFSFASSAELAVQIEGGAPADVFASADPALVARLDDLVRGEPVRVATNRLVVVTPRDDPAGVARPADVARPGVALVVAAPEVPAGKYARVALRRLGVLAAAERNVVSNEADAKAVVTKVGLGEADAGVCFATDVTAELRALELPPRAQVPAAYPVAALSADADARTFVSFVASARGRAVLEGHGFGPP